MSKVGSYIFRRLCHPLPPNTNHWTAPTKRDQLAEYTCRFRRRILPLLDGRVLEIGAGNGILAEALRDAGAGRIVATDYWDKFGEFVDNCVEDCTGLDFVRADSRCLPFGGGVFDAVITQDGFEHFLQPGEALTDAYRVLKPRGTFIVTFGPPWFSPRGGHMMFLRPPPWFHLAFSDKMIFAVRARYRSDGVKNWTEGYSPLSKITVARFRRLARAAGFAPLEETLWPVRSATILTTLPFVREFFCNLYAGIWQKQAGEE